jgi:hypothetical protein
MYTIEIKNKIQEVYPLRLEKSDKGYKLVFTTLFKNQKVISSEELTEIDKFNKEPVDEIIIVRPLSNSINLDKSKNTLIITLDNVDNIVSINLIKPEKE